jgi:hypothetical protein
LDYPLFGDIVSYIFYRRLKLLFDSNFNRGNWKKAHWLVLPTGLHGMQDKYYVCGDQHPRKLVSPGTNNVSFCPRSSIAKYILINEFKNYLIKYIRIMMSV